jgi:hypothetical protein
MIARFLVAISLLSIFCLCSCDGEEETLPKINTPIIDSSLIKKNDIDTTKPVAYETEYQAMERKLRSLPQIKRSSKDQTDNKKENLKSKIVDFKGDSLYSIKFGNKIDTNFVTEYEFYIHKKTKEVKVYDRGEDRMIPLDEWKKNEE